MGEKDVIHHKLSETIAEYMLKVKEGGGSIDAMLRTGYVCDPRYQNHEVPPGHPERPERIGALLSLMERYSREGLVKIEPRAATIEEISANHDRRYVDQVRATAGKPYFAFDPDTHAYSETYETALLSAGGVLSLTEHIMAGKVDNGFAMVRPPGHHAEADRAMGFCFFNNVAIGARYLRSEHKLDRVLIVDWDVHHGNGTQRSFYADRSVLYVSLHQYPHYPGTGAANEVGVADGLGYTVNIPFNGGCGDEEYAAAFHRIIEPVSRQFDPQFVLVSAGFDTHRRDPLSQMRVTREGFKAMTRSLLAVARDCSQGRLAVVLEGGYDLGALEESVSAVLDELGGEDLGVEIPHGGGAETTLDAVTRVHKRFWKL
jgi:acetoin utilization deacetylase AcuC-like enzyme